MAWRGVGQDEIFDNANDCKLHIMLYIYKWQRLILMCNENDLSRFDRCVAPMLWNLLQAEEAF